MREWLVIESSMKGSIFAPDELKRGYIPRDIAEPLLGRVITGTVWFTKEESAKMRAHPEWRDTEPPNTGGLHVNTVESAAGRGLGGAGLRGVPEFQETTGGPERHQADHHGDHDGDSGGGGMGRRGVQQRDATNTIAPGSKSYPYLALAQQYDLDYGMLLIMSDVYCGRRVEWHQRFEAFDYFAARSAVREAVFKAIIEIARG